MKRYTVATFHEHLLEVLDEVLETGAPVEIEREGQTLLLTKATPSAKLDRLKRRDVIVSDPEDLVSLELWT